jgi:hypothetical protein
MPKRPGKSKKTTVAPKTGKTAGSPEPGAKSVRERRRDWNTKAILDKFQGRKSI